jgi:hypothetical protein
MVRNLLIVIFLVTLALPATAEQRPKLSEEEMQQRLAFITERLNAGKNTARAWQYGWSGFFAASTAFQYYMVKRSNNSDNEAQYTVGAIKSAAGLALMLLRPLPAVKGAKPVEAMPADTPNQRAERLQAAEGLLHKNADRARERKSWARHLGSIAIHFLGSTAIAALGDFKDAAISNASGIAISQVHIWSQPYRAIDDLTAYGREFPAAPSGEKPSWQLTHIPGGLGISITF